MIVDSSANLVSLPTTKTSGYTVATPDVGVTNVNPIASPSAPARINQQRIIPAAVKQPAISNPLQVVKATPGSLILPDGTSAQFIFTLTSDQGNQLIAVPSVSFFIGGDNLNGAHWPGPIYGMGVMPTSVFNDDYFSDGVNVVTQAVIRNNSGDAQLVYCYCNWRLIFSQGSSAPVLTVVPRLPVGGRGGL